MRRKQFIDENRIGTPQQIRPLALDLAQDAHAKPRTWKRMAEHDLARQSQLEAELAHLVLEQFTQRLEQLQMQRFRKTADVVMRLDVLRLARLGARRFDDVGIDRALREPFHVLELRRLALEHVDE